jgi:hypothetical protein
METETMDDIVEMLRLPTGCVPPSEWEIKAADEIERLRRRVGALEMIIAEDLYPDDCSDEMNRMLVEQIRAKSRT